MDVVDAAATRPLYLRELCAVIAMDVVNAFNTAKSQKIVEALRAKGMPDYLMRIVQNYLSN